MRRALAGLIALSIVLIVVFEHTPTGAPTGIAPQVAQVRGAVVHIQCSDGPQGSGCLIDPSGILFTARHVTDGDYEATYTVTLDDGRAYRAKYILEDRENDVAYMKLELPPGTRTPYVQLAVENTLRVGDAVFVFGSPLGKNNVNTVSMGILSAVNRHLDERPGWEEYTRYKWHAMLQSTSSAFPGNSGGPVFDMRGRVIGVLVAGEAETLNFAVPVARFRDTIESVRQWFLLCRLRPLMPDMCGPQGPPGPQGEPGEPGPQGPPGDPNNHVEGEHL